MRLTLGLHPTKRPSKHKTPENHRDPCLLVAYARPAAPFAVLVAVAVEVELAPGSPPSSVGTYAADALVVGTMFSRYVVNGAAEELKPLPLALEVGKTGA